MIEGSILPKLVLVGHRFTDRETMRRIEEAVEAGVQWVHLRDHEAEDEPFHVAAEDLSKRLIEAHPATLVSVNARLSVARKLGLHFHTGFWGGTVDEARRVLGPQAVIGFSAHSFEEGDAAVRLGADYLFFSPVYDTAKSGGRGLDALRLFCERVDAPVFALGGVTPDRTRQCLDAGAYGVAVLSAILDADEVGPATRSFLSRFTQHGTSPC